MTYTEKVLLADEQIIFRATLHWIIYLQGMLIMVFGALVSCFNQAILSPIIGPNFAGMAQHIIAGVGLFIVFIGLMLLSGAYIRQTSTELAITNKRIIAKYGFISRTTFEIMITRITGANFDQTVIGRMLDFGTILIHGAGGEISPIDNIEDPQRFHQALMTVMEKARFG